MINFVVKRGFCSNYGFFIVLVVKRGFCSNYGFLLVVVVNPSLVVVYPGNNKI